MCKKELSDQRNYGIDLLRIIAAFYIIILHTVLQGGIYNATSPYSYQFFSCQFLTSCSLCAVNIFGIISGYVGYTDSEKQYNLVSYITLWLEVVFYGVIITLCYMYFLPNTVTTSDLFSTLLPVSNNLYWYFTAYSLLFIFTPLLNSSIRNCSKQTLILFSCLILFVFSPLETITDCFSAKDGYSFLWLLILYLMGSIIKKLKIGSNIRPLAAICGIGTMNICIFFLYNLPPQFYVLNHMLTSNTAEKYTLPFHLISAILHVILFSKLKLGSKIKKIIAFAAPGAFSVYLINVQNSFWTYGMTDRFRPWASSSAAGIVVRVILFALLFVTISVIFDHFRQKLFRHLPIKRMINTFCSTIHKIGTH